MKITELKSSVEILKLLNGARFIGMGTTAICFLLKDGRVLKLYYNPFYKRRMNDSYDSMISHYEILDFISNDSYIGLDEIILNSNGCIGYLYPYVNASPLYYAKHFFTMSDIIVRYQKLVDDTKKVSMKKFMLGDLHDLNILLGVIFYIIDLDYGHIEEELSTDEIFNHNIKYINKTIIHSLFGVKIDQLIKFNNYDIYELYRKAIGGNVEAFLELLETFNKICDPKKSNALNLRMSISYEKFHNDYYKYF